MTEVYKPHLYENVREKFNNKATESYREYQLYAATLQRGIDRLQSLEGTSVAGRPEEPVAGTAP